MAAALPRAVSSPGEGIVLPGRNCWHVERADRVRCVQDAADYFRWVRRALLGAQRSIFILGWDLQAIDLLPAAAPPPTRIGGEPERAGDEPDGPTRLNAVLAHVARRRPRLRVSILIWDYDALYTLERDPFLRWRMGWRMPRHVRLGFDDRHPPGASHHQKLVVVDDAIAFAGSLDLTTHRFDTCEHCLDHPLRVTSAGAAYGPYHEVGLMLSGPAAARLGELARDRWRASQGGRKIPPIAWPAGSAADPAAVPRAASGASAPEDLWPADATPDLHGVEVGIARTMPECGSQPAVRECETLLLDAIGAARRSIYIESQYFTSDVLGDALAARLREPDGPEVIVVVPRECHGWLERNTMGAFRDEVFLRMAAADRHGRLRLLYPMASRQREVATFIHSKVLVADDVLLRIGSANFARRSMGLDSECDLAVDATGDARARDGIRRVRDRLVGEHLGMTADEVGKGIDGAGSLRAFVDERASADRTFVRIDPATLVEPDLPEAVRAAADPEGPVGLEVVLEAVPQVGGSRLAGAGAAGLAFLSLFPVELMAVAAGILLGVRSGVVAAFAGGLVAATTGYAAGWLLGVGGLVRWMNPRARHSARQLGASGVRGVLRLRLSSVASAGAVHLFCGARRARFGPYLLGSALAFTPQVIALAGLGALLRQTVATPSISHRLVTLAVVLLLLLAAAMLRSVLLRRRLAPSIERHRVRAEFG